MAEAASTTTATPQKQPRPRLIWTVRLADVGEDFQLPPGVNDVSDVNTTMCHRTDVFDIPDGVARQAITHDNIHLRSAGQVCRKVVQQSGEWLLKIARRFVTTTTTGSGEGGETGEKNSSAVILRFGGGFPPSEKDGENKCRYSTNEETLVLIDPPASKSSSKLNLKKIAASAPRVQLNLVVAPRDDDGGDDGDDNDSRAAKYGLIPPNDYLLDHLEYAQEEHGKTPVCLYVCPTTNCHTAFSSADSLNPHVHIIRLWSQPDNPFEIERMQYEKVPRKKKAAPKKTAKRTTKTKETASSTAILAAAAKKGATTNKEGADSTAVKTQTAAARRTPQKAKGGTKARGASASPIAKKPKPSVDDVSSPVKAINASKPLPTAKKTDKTTKAAESKTTKAAPASGAKKTGGDAKKASSKQKAAGKPVEAPNVGTEDSSKPKETKKKEGKKKAAAKSAAQQKDDSSIGSSVNLAVDAPSSKKSKAPAKRKRKAQEETPAGDDATPSTEKKKKKAKADKSEDGAKSSDKKAKKKKRKPSK